MQTAIHQFRSNFRDATGTDYPLDTAEFAALNGVKPASVRVRLCNTASYFGVIPLKLANGRLKWPAVQVTAEVA